MNWLQAPLRYPRVAVVLVALVVLAGGQALWTMPRLEDPRITIRTGLVLAAYPGATSQQVEKQVTEVLERHILKFAEVRQGKTFSTSRPGLAVVNVELEADVVDADRFWAKLRAELDFLRDRELPHQVQGPTVNTEFGDTVAMLLAVHGGPYDYRQRRDFVERLQEHLRRLPDVGRLAVYGQQNEQIWITGDLTRTAQFGVEPLRLAAAVQQRHETLGAGSLDAGQTQVPLHTTGALRAEDDLRSLIVDIGRNGAPVRLGDLATVERRYQDPRFVVRYNGQPALLLSVEMKKGRNMVRLGEQVRAALADLRPLLPPDLQIDAVADQPAMVASRLDQLQREFLLAIAAVILVTVLLLPLRVAVIAALAIPVTLLSTIGVMDLCGVPLHQVSIAALILVLGIVVDDAIVIADNHVDLLDRGRSVAQAAAQSATEVIVPVLTATLTIVASFLPLLVLTGSAGEFIEALPLTVAIALTVSFVVAVLFTPLLCRVFIRQGLAHPPRSGRAPLDLLTAGYRRAIGVAMGHRWLVLGLGLTAASVGVLLLGTLRQQFFPVAERDQFVIDVWLPAGSRIEATDAALRQVEADLAVDGRVRSWAAFVGQSAPRFYYNVNPQQPDNSYGQVLVNTRSAADTGPLVASLRRTLPRRAPEALFLVKELQQGMQLEAPVEVRLSGPDLATLNRLADQVSQALAAVPGAQFVHTDWHPPSLRVDVDLDYELAARLGIPCGAVAQYLAGGLDGRPLGVYWEGNRPLMLLCRLDPDRRASFDDLRDAYVAGPGGRVRAPLGAIATLTPQWQPSRIVRRNGVRTVTVRALPAAGLLAEDILRAAAPAVDSLRLPLGYRVEFGGDRANRAQTLPDMVRALGISLLAIYLVMLLQFRSLAGPLVVMASIPWPWAVPPWVWC